MAQIDKKHKKEFTRSFGQLDGGVNYSVPPDAIADNELADSLNFIYDPYTGRPMTRPAKTKFSTGSPLSGSINGLHKYIYSGGFYIVCSSDGILYNLDNLNAYVSIGSIGSSDSPTFLDFNDKVIIANGQMWSWDGTTLVNMTTDYDAPKTHCIFSLGGRILAIGDSDLPHQIKLCGPGDMTDWDASSGDAVRFDIDDKSGEGIIGGNLLLNDIIIFKGPQQRGIYRLVIPSGDFDNASIENFSNKESCLNYQSSIQYAGNLFFLDNVGFGSLKGIREYGDIGLDPIGKNINSSIVGMLNSDYAMLFGMPYYNQIWIKYSNIENLFVFNPIKNSFMPIRFPGSIVQSAEYIESDKVLLIGMDDGGIYKLDPLSYVDEDSDFKRKLCIIFKD